MENELIKEQDLIFKAYQRKLLRKLEEQQAVLNRGDRLTIEQILAELIEDTKQALAD